MIIEHFKNTDKYQDIVNNYDIFVPDQFVSEKEKNSPDWVKSTLDYYATIAHSQYWNNEKIKKNYDLLNGILHRDDYFTEDYERLVEFFEGLLKGDNFFVEHFILLVDELISSFEMSRHVNIRKDNCGGIEKRLFVIIYELNDFQ
jgi:glutaredoxin 2